MPLPIDWFEIVEETNDLDNVLFFLERLPDNLYSLFDERTSDFLEYYLFNDPEIKNTPGLFFEAFGEAKEGLEIELKNFIDNLRENDQFRANAKSTLQRIGFTNQSLRLKAAILRKLWRKILDHMKRTGDKIITFAKDKTVKLVRDFLQYLNSVLGSLKQLIPGIEAIKEFKEIIENYLVIAEN